MSKPPTQATIAKELGISRATVAEILGGSNAHRYNEETRRRVVQTAKDLGYRPNRQARLLTGARSGVIGILKSISTHLRNIEMVLNVGEAIHQRGYEIMSSDLFWHNDGMARAANALIDIRAEGIILAHQGVNFGLNPEIQRIARMGVPMVSVAGEATEGLPHVTPDYFEIAKEIVRHLKAAGYEQVAVVSQPQSKRSHGMKVSNMRIIEGVMEAAREVGFHEVEICPYHTLPSTNSTCMNEGVGKQTIAHLIQRQKTKNVAVIFENDAHAIAAIAHCHESGIRVPEDIGIVGMDGSPGGAISWPSLTTVKHPTKALATAGVDLIFDLIAGVPIAQDVITLPCELVIRNSTRAVHQSV